VDLKLLLITIWTNIGFSFILFMLIVCDFAKKFLSSRRLPNIQWKFSRALFTLLPLLGVQYFILALIKSNWLTQILVVVFTASHGLVVAVVVCFLSEELCAALKLWISSCQVNTTRPNTFQEEARICSRDEQTISTE